MKRLVEGVEELVRMQRPSTMRTGIIIADRETFPLSLSETVQSVLGEVEQVRLHLDSAEDRLQQMLTWTQDTHRPDPGPNQFNE